MFERLAAVGEIRPPAQDGIATGESRRREAAPEIGAFWKSVSEGAALRRVSHGPRLCEVMAAVIEAAARQELAAEQPEQLEKLQEQNRSSQAGEFESKDSSSSIGTILSLIA